MGGIGLVSGCLVVMGRLGLVDRWLRCRWAGYVWYMGGLGWPWAGFRSYFWLVYGGTWGTGLVESKVL